MRVLRLSKLKIENYRNFKSLEIDLEPDCTILVGENNSGKTNVLEALYACLRANRLVRQGAFETSDFHLESPAAFPGEAGPITLTATFMESEHALWDIDLVSVLENAINLEKGTGRRSISIQVQGTAPIKSDEGTYDWNFLDAAGKPKPQKFISTLNRLQSLRPLEYLDAIRDAKRQFSQGSTYFGPFVRDPRFDDTLREVLLDGLADINQRVLEAHTVFSVLKQNLDAGQTVVQSTKVEAARIEAVPSRLSDLLQNTQISFENQDGVPLPLALHGSGTQSLSVLSLFRAYVAAKLAAREERLAEPILMIEEPESHLHPSGSRAVWGLLGSFVGQSVVTTHSGDLIGEAELRCVRRISRGPHGVVCTRVDDSAFDEGEKQHINYYIRLSRGELLFANSWILVEGKSELMLMAGIALAAGIDLYSQGIRVIEHSMHGRVKPFIKLADQLGIHWHCVCDNDPKGQEDAQHARLLLSGRIESSHITLLDARNLEVFLCKHGFAADYLAAIPPGERAKITLPPSAVGYHEQICDHLPSGQKVPTAIRIAERIKADPTLLPPILRQAILECQSKG